MKFFDKVNPQDIARREEKILKHDINLPEKGRLKNMYDLLPEQPEMKHFYEQGGFGLSTEEIVGADQWEKEKEAMIILPSLVWVCVCLGLIRPKHSGKS